MFPTRFAKLYTFLQSNDDVDVLIPILALFPDGWTERPNPFCHRVRFTTAAALVHELMEARDEKKRLRFQQQIAAYELLLVDELGFVPLSKTGAELLFEVFSQHYERTSTLVTSNLPFQEWTEILGSERLTGALLGRLTHHVHILEMNGDSYRLKQSKHKRDPANP